MKSIVLNIIDLGNRIPPTYQVVVDGTVIVSYKEYTTAMLVINKLLGKAEGKWPTDLVDADGMKG